MRIMRKQARMVAAVALALSSLTVALPARADGPGATLQVQAGWDGQAHAGVLVPVWVDLTAGPQAVQGELQLAYTQTNPWGPGKPSGKYTLDVQIPAGGHVRKLMLVQNDVGGGTLGPLKLLVDGKEAASADVKIENQSITRLMGVLGDDTVAQALAIPEPAPVDQPQGGGGGKFGGMPTIPEASRPVRLIHLDPAKLPDRGIGLESLDVVVVDRFAAGNLTPEQKKTLQDYVVAGGKLMLAGGPEGARVIQPFADWLGVKVGDVKNVPLSTFGAPQPQGPVAERTVPVLTIEGKGLRTMATAGQQPVALVKSVGAGSVLLLTYDPALAPLAGWTGRKPYWEDLVRGIFPATTFQMGGGKWGGPQAPGGIDMQMAWAVQRVSAANMPSQTKWLLLLGGYGLLLGPVNFLVWRLVKRPGAAWPTALVGALGATLVFWPLARRLDPPVIVNPVAVFYGSSDSSLVKVTQLVGITTLPESQGEVSMPQADWLSMVALPPQGPFNGQPPMVSELGSINLGNNTVQVKADLKGGTQAIIATGTADLGGTLALDVHMEKDHLVGTLTNRTDRTWRDVILAAGQSYQRIAATLKPGQEESISFLLPSAMPPGGCCGIIGVQAGISQAYQPIFQQGGPFQEIAAWPMVQRMNLAQAVGQHFWQESGGNYQVVLVGWTDEVPLPIQVGGQTRKVKGVAMMGQEVKLSLGKGAYTLPPGLMPATNTEWVVDDPQFNGMFGPDMGVPAVGSAAYSFQLPSELTPAGVKNLSLALAMPQGVPGKPPVTEFWNWANNAWEAVTIQGGVESTIVNGKRFVSPSGEIQVRISRHDKPDPMKGGMYPIGKPMVGVQGEEVAS